MYDLLTSNERDYHSKAIRTQNDMIPCSSSCFCKVSKIHESRMTTACISSAVQKYLLSPHLYTSTLFTAKINTVYLWEFSKVKKSFVYAF